MAMHASTKTEFDVPYATDGDFAVLQGYSCHITTNKYYKNDGIAVYSENYLYCTRVPGC